ncbi:DUF4145 domain-containing protein [Proteus faecis]|uniref:DUF4145 domain-containing protein n=1 Tax=Proteus faecis TaxID=2050967 RepID=UPI000D69A916|nr:DUF4145 domain-containing protein [Proteus faecis]
MSEYVAPTFKGKAFPCPHCKISSHMIWTDILHSRLDSEDYTLYTYSATCSHCNQCSIWNSTLVLADYSHINSIMIYPDSSGVPLPSKDMPSDVKQDYIEAACIYPKSPRGAVALLRLGLQKLCMHLGGEGKNINADLAKLAEDELVSKKLIRSADIIRIVGNNAVHPGTISDDDFDDVSFKLFALINMIVQQGITEPKEVDNMFGSLPEGPRQAAENRDKPKSK